VAKVRLLASVDSFVNPDVGLAREPLLN